MKDLTEAQLIEMERAADSLVHTLDHDPEAMKTGVLIDTFTDAFEQAQSVAEEVATLCEHLRALSIAAKDAT